MRAEYQLLVHDPLLPDCFRNKTLRKDFLEIIGNDYNSSISYKLFFFFFHKDMNKAQMVKIFKLFVTYA